jgi:hypothetical protein
MSAMPPFLMKSEFHPDGIYRINIDTNADAQADAAFTFVFSELKDGKQTGTAYYATGPEARQPEPAGKVLITGTPVGFDANAQAVQAGRIRLFIGVRSDPFFADADGSFHGFKWTGQDAFADRNILSIALQVPDDMLSSEPEIGVWASVSVRQDGAIVQVDRRRAPDDQPVRQPEQHQERVQPPPASRRPGQLPGAVVQAPRRQRLPAGGSKERGPDRAARHPPLRPHQASRLPQRPRPRRRRLQRPLRLAEQREGRPRRSQTARRHADRVPVPRRAQPLPRLIAATSA